MIFKIFKFCLEGIRKKISGNHFTRIPNIKQRKNISISVNQDLKEFKNLNSRKEVNNKKLYEQARTQWQIGDWASLTTLDQETISENPSRSKLALLVASGWMQCGDHELAKKYILLAKEWGANKIIITRILTAGVHNNLGHASMIINQENRAYKHYERSIILAMPASDAPKYASIRLGSKHQQRDLNFDQILNLRNLTLSKSNSFDRIREDQ